MQPATSVRTRHLEQLVGKRVKFFLGSGRALTGRLREFDQESVVITGKNRGDPDSLIELRSVSTCRAALKEEE